MYFVYILKNQINSLVYIGFTKDLRKRLKEHQQGRSKYVGHRGKWELIYYEAYKSMKDAIVREKMLKNYGSSLGHLKKRIKFSLIDI